MLGKRKVGNDYYLLQPEELPKTGGGRRSYFGKKGRGQTWSAKERFRGGVETRKGLHLRNVRGQPCVPSPGLGEGEKLYGTLYWTIGERKHFRAAEKERYTERLFQRGSLYR